MLGILGGMGPLASAEFVKTIYEYNLPLKSEQDTPKIVLYSDPSFPDRTEVLIKGNDLVLHSRLVEALSKLADLGVNKIIICCITSHSFLPSLPLEFSQRIISLIDVIFKAVLENPSPYLLLCTQGTIKRQVFQQHPLWNEAEKYIYLPNLRDQELIHNMIYQIKQQGKITHVQDTIIQLKDAYQVNHLIAGCTEIHLLSKFWNLPNINPTANLFLDALMLIAQNLDQYL
jgi:aspartate racemase